MDIDKISILEKDYDDNSPSCLFGKLTFWRSKSQRGYNVYECRYCSDYYKEFIKDDDILRLTEEVKECYIYSGILTPKNVCRKCVSRHLKIENQTEQTRILKKIVELFTGNFSSDLEKIRNDSRDKTINDLINKLGEQDKKMNDMLKERDKKMNDMLKERDNQIIKFKANFLEKIEIKFDCCICMEDQLINNMIKLDCKHSFCNKCIDHIKRDNTVTCPLCRYMSINAK